MSTDRMVIVDIETFGLDAREDPILELGFKIVDLDFNVIDDFQAIVWDSPFYDSRHDALMRAVSRNHEASVLVHDMHMRSNLWVDAQHEGRTSSEVEDAAMDWLLGHGIDRTDPLCGSSVQFDREMLREQMSGVFDLFSYRNIDTSSIKELCMRFNPGLYARMPEVTTPRKLHRVLPDIDDTIGEFKFYSDEFLIWSPSS